MDLDWGPDPTRIILKPCLRKENDFRFELQQKQLQLLMDQNKILVDTIQIMQKQNADLESRVESLESLVKQLIPSTASIQTQTDLKMVRDPVEDSAAAAADAAAAELPATNENDQIRVDVTVSGKCSK